MNKLILLSFILSITFISADTVTLKNGQVFTNVKATTGNGMVYLEMPDRSKKEFKRDEVKGIQKSEIKVDDESGKKERERLWKLKVEKERLEKERLERERLEKERLERERRDSCSTTADRGYEICKTKEDRTLKICELEYKDCRYGCIQDRSCSTCSQEYSDCKFIARENEDKCSTKVYNAYQNCTK